MQVCILISIPICILICILFIKKYYINSGSGKNLSGKESSFTQMGVQHNGWRKKLRKNRRTILSVWMAKGSDSNNYVERMTELTLTILHKFNEIAKKYIGYNYIGEKYVYSFARTVVIVCSFIHLYTCLYTYYIHLIYMQVVADQKGLYVILKHVQHSGTYCHAELSIVEKAPEHKHEECLLNGYDQRGISHGDYTKLGDLNVILHSEDVIKIINEEMKYEDPLKEIYSDSEDEDVVENKENEDDSDCIYLDMGFGYVKFVEKPNTNQLHKDKYLLITNWSMLCKKMNVVLNEFKRQYPKWVEMSDKELKSKILKVAQGLYTCLYTYFYTYLYTCLYTVY